MAIGVVIIVLDAVLNASTKGKMKLPPLAVGIGFYLPAAVTTDPAAATPALGGFAARLAQLTARKDPHAPQ